MIRIRCRTNLDDYARFAWPTCVACRPEIGDSVMSITRGKSLKIVDITHSEAPDLETGKSVPFLLIELHR